MGSPDPGAFKLTLKAPKRITHDARLRDCAERVHYFIDTAAVLGQKLGALLFQLPSTVNITVQRANVSENLEYTLTRDTIPIHSVETAFMLNDKTGYVLVNQFTSNTQDECISL